ncbi:MAG TPA: CDGSH iron-sulfur domain-containing protein [Bacteroidales bacterium]|nr:CDGSH iron-sulfur domain-containing protein [Bacteroidales bacterium]
MDNEKQNTQTCIEIAENGPAIVSGKCIITDKKTGKVSETKNVFALCRCGKTKNRPFCDGSHVKYPFE